MNDKKNLDRLFQEKFKDFETEPNEKVWKNIEAALKEKNRRKVIPFWWKLSGIAAALFLGFLAWNLILDNPKPENNVVMGPEKTKPVENQTETNAVVDAVNLPATDKIQQKTIKNNNIKEIGNPVATEVKNNDIKAIKNGKTKINIHSADAIAKTGRNKTADNKTTKITLNPDKTIAGESNTTGNKNIENDKFAHPKNHLKNNNGFQTKNVVAGTSSEKIKHKATPRKKSDKTIIAENPNPETIADHSTKKSFATNPDGQSIAIKETPPEEKKLDSTAVATVVPNALEELLQQKNEKETKIAKTKLNRWQVTSNVAPVYFSSTSNGSPIASEFAGNSKSYENNLAYGLGVNYAVNKKLSIRTGINKLTLAYNTNDVVFFAGLQSQNFNNITVSGNGAPIEIMNKDAANAGLLPFENSIQSTNSGVINQKMGYIEVPMELSYKLLDKKFGISFIGGLSTLFLNQNEIRVVSPTMTATLGKANNLNDVHFSTNVGLGFKYRFWKAFEFNFEPTFKYQMNTFSNGSGNFKPYFIGLYSGLGFSF